MPARKPNIPINGMPQSMAWYIKPIKETVDMITGAAGEELVRLKDEPTLAEIVAKINEIIARINVSGEAKASGKSKHPKQY